MLSQSGLLGTSWNVIALSAGEVIGQAQYGRGDHTVEKLSFGKVDILRIVSARQIDPRRKIPIDQRNKVPGDLTSYVPDGWRVPYATLEQLAGARSDTTALKAMALDLGLPAIQDTAKELGFTSSFVFEPQENGLVAVRSGNTNALEVATSFDAAMKVERSAAIFRRGGHADGLRRSIEAISGGVYPRRPGRVEKAAQVARLTLTGSVSSYPVTQFPNKHAFWVPTPQEKDPLGGQFHEVAQLGGITLAVTSSGHDIRIPESPDHPAYDVLATLGAVAYRESLS